MNGYQILFISFILLGLTNSPAQVNGNKSTVPRDSSKMQSAAYPVNFNNYNSLINPSQSDHKLSLKEMYNLYYLYGRRNAYEPYNEFDYSDLLTEQQYENRYSSEDSLKYFNKNLYLILKLQKKEMDKYDLGGFGKFLGISNEIIAVILAMRQFKK